MSSQRRLDDDDNYYRGRRAEPRPRRSPSPDYVYASGALAVTQPPNVPDTRLQYGPPPYSHGALYRPRSVPSGLDRASSRSPSPRYTARYGRKHEQSPSRSRSRSRDILTRARTTVKDTFTDSTSGLGVGVLGAILGGLAAHGAADATARSRSSPREHQKARLISTVVGAAVGGLGANAFEKKRADARVRNREEKQEEERRRASDRDRNRDYYDGRPGPGRRGRRGSSVGSDRDEFDRRHVSPGYDHVYERRVTSGRRADDGPLRPGW